jgi:Outer membrane protein beta-barrel domain
MKRIHLALVLVSVCVLGFAAQASAGPVGTLEANLGYVKSSNDVTGGDESLGGGLAFGAGYWRSASPMVSWGAEMSYDNLGSLDYTDPATPSTGTLSSHVLRIEPALRVNFGSMVGPNFFAQGGAGYYNVSVKDENSVYPEVSNSEGKFGFSIGAGVGFPVGAGTRMNVSGHYNSVSTEGESLNYLAFRAGVGFGL